MSVDVQINGPDMSIVADRAMRAALFAVAEQALGDCNFYCKQDTNALIGSSVIHSDTDAAELVWNMPYAEYQYYLPNTHTDVNPNATSHWCEVAENNHRQQWDITFQNALRSNGL